MVEAMVKAFVTVVVGVDVEFEDDGELNIRDQAYEAAIGQVSVTGGDILDVMVEDIEE